MEKIGENLDFNFSIWEELPFWIPDAQPPVLGEVWGAPRPELPMPGVARGLWDGPPDSVTRASEAQSSKNVQNAF